MSMFTAFLQLMQYAHTQRQGRTDVARRVIDMHFAPSSLKFSVVL